MLRATGSRGEGGRAMFEPYALEVALVRLDAGKRSVVGTLALAKLENSP